MKCGYWQMHIFRGKKGSLKIKRKTPPFGRGLTVLLVLQPTVNFDGGNGNVILLKFILSSF
jgi:hypothetical protein